MKRVSTMALEAGMMLAEAINNQQNTVELLRKGSILKKNQIYMIEQLGLFDVLIYEPEDLVADESPKTAVPYQVNDHLSQSLEEIETIDFNHVVTSVCNRNMQINLLTGDGNIPIDEKHAATLTKTKQTFEKIKLGEPIDRVALELQVETLLPDMIRNNDVLMRLQQLRTSDDYTFNHSLRVSMLASMIGKWLGYSFEQLKELALAGLLFDIGKLKLPEEILMKPGPLSDAEMELVQKHSQLGYLSLLKTSGISQDVKFAALQHHERLDGTGYPLHVSEGQIHEYSRIIMVCDTFDAMIQDRVYRKKVSPFQAAEYLSWHSGSTFDSKICYVLISNLAEFYMGKSCTLSTGEQGRIVYIDVNEPIRPIVQIGNHFVDLTKRRDVYVALLE